MHITDKTLVEEKNTFLDKLREEVQNEIETYLFSSENETKRKRNIPIKDYYADDRTPEQKESDRRKRIKAVTTAKLATKKVFEEESNEW